MHVFKREESEESEMERGEERERERERGRREGERDMEMGRERGRGRRRDIVIASPRATPGILPPPPPNTPAEQNYPVFETPVCWLSLGPYNRQSQYGDCETSAKAT